ncbi:hypothetical protein [Taibaiella chishuiensis]|uniref:Uncharacterized protein n=1 Tax=Taibaiella chishuiensis TaxID=1434707 RepID=A0A2P8DAV7_9BACT|nr:hypothetical protein [Taibaiella chishuiensis]PSK94352.1 hypothetical protein B0I18_101507 [Taibaiella chishuiensis]
MDTNSWSFGEGYCKIKTARQKKRLQKKDFEKQVLQLYRRREDLATKQYNLPLVPLDEPYQKGWKRSFVLRDDVARSRHAPFFRALLDKINTVMYHHDKHFKISTKKKRKRILVDTPQELRAFLTYEWNSTRNKLTEAERRLFYPREFVNRKGQPAGIRYVFAEAWRYRLQVKPHMITHRKMVDEVLEQEIQQLDNYIESHHLNPKMNKLVDGSCYTSWRHRDYNLKYRLELFKQPVHRIMDLCITADNEEDEQF